jgi:hypothetical protein
LIYFLGILGVPLSSLVISTAMLFVTWRMYSRLIRDSAAGPSGKSSTPST